MNEATKGTGADGQSFVEHYVGLDNPLTIQVAAVIGSAGASLTELILLRSLFSLFSLKFLAAFVAVIFAMAMIAGYAAFLFF
ncbi:hypothetical protein [Vreelandella andesensis]|uniref:hypothetical protein n=1 Tax=Vreelandella andesensis TaxID=447567 RepID=UPI001FC915E7|nr:hypothetical protein [Halomonas andesensis]